MKAKVLFQQIARLFLMIVIVASSLSTPSQGVLAKPLTAPFTDCASQSQIPAAECDVLVALYNSTGGGSTWMSGSSSWLQIDTPCNWQGVTCENGTHVTELYLPYNQLSGSIPVELGSLTNLTRLDLSHNQLGAFNLS